MGMEVARIFKQTISQSNKIQLTEFHQGFYKNTQRINIGHKIQKWVVIYRPEKKHFIRLKDFTLPLGKLLFPHTPPPLTTETQLKSQSSKPLSKCHKVLLVSMDICFSMGNSAAGNPGTFSPCWPTLLHLSGVFYSLAVSFTVSASCYGGGGRSWAAAFPLTSQHSSPFTTPVRALLARVINEHHCPVLLPAAGVGGGGWDGGLLQADG